jgi:hypothetical protein
MFDEDRYTRWRRASHGLHLIESELVHTVQTLGRIDADLFPRDVRYREIRENNDGTNEEWREMAEHAVPMGYLWVLGAYEVIRTLDQMFRQKKSRFEGQQHLETEQLKIRFERVRIPLAKLEPAKKFMETDNRFAVPALICGRGLGWHVADDVSIARGELSTQFLEFLEELKATVIP